jgi:hypothetical protein
VKEAALSSCGGDRDCFGHDARPARGRRCVTSPVLCM